MQSMMYFNAINNVFQYNPQSNAEMHIDKVFSHNIAPILLMEASLDLNTIMIYLRPHLRELVKICEGVAIYAINSQ